VDPAGASVSSVLELLARRVRGVLGPDLVGVYLTGSAVTDRFRPSMSDVDVFVVCRGPLSARVCAELDRMHAEILRDHPWGARLDVEYTPRSGLRPDGVDGAVSWTRDGGLGPGSRRVASDDILGVRMNGRAVVGPPASSVFPAVSPEVFRRQTVEYLWDLLSRPRTRPGARPEVVAGWIANTARCLYRLATGELGSKPDAMAWWTDRDPVAGDILLLVDPAVQGDPVAGQACVEAFPTVVLRAEVLAATLSLR
jgi:hypothetical protein